eukprot:scaffold11716_cov165-Amphora_coffeaeformis.AAC.1
MTEKEAQAKQLDSVTDRVEEQEVDLGKAQMAMSSLGGVAADAALSAIAVSAADVQVICDELEVTEENATKVLRQVAAAGIVPNTEDHDVWVAAALRHLITEAP